MSSRNVSIFKRAISLFAAAAFAVISVAAIGAAAQAQEPVAEIPYRYAYTGWITIPVTVNGEGPYDFIVDTGATISVVFENLNQQQNFPFVEGDLRRILGLIEANDLPPRYIGDLEAGGLTLDNLTSVVIPDWAEPRATPQGVLGLDFLSQYTIYINPEKQTVSFYKGRASNVTSGRRWSNTKLQPILFQDSLRPLYIVKSRIRGRSYPFILDLGASGTIVNYEAVRDMLSTRRVTVRNTRPTRLPQVQDLFGNEARSQLIRIQEMKIGRATWRNKIVSVFDSEVFNELGVGEEPYGLLGADMIADRHTVIDFEENRIHFGRPLRRRNRPSN